MRYQLKISLKNSEPLIWRRIQIEPSLLLPDVHRIFQTTFGWTNSHLHSFIANEKEYIPAEFGIEDTINSRLVRFNQLLENEGDELLYLYDFGDYWLHDVLLEKIIHNNSLPLALFLDGDQPAPPEDCGGLSGYYELCEILSNPKHFEYKEMATWLGGKRSLDDFKPGKINRLFKRKDFGCKWIE